MAIKILIKIKLQLIETIKQNKPISCRIFSKFHMFDVRLAIQIFHKNTCTLPQHFLLYRLLFLVRVVVNIIADEVNQR